MTIVNWHLLIMNDLPVYLNDLSVDINQAVLIFATQIKLPILKTRKYEKPLGASLQYNMEIGRQVN